MRGCVLRYHVHHICRRDLQPPLDDAYYFYNCFLSRWMHTHPHELLSLLASDGKALVEQTSPAKGSPSSASSSQERVTLPQCMDVDHSADSFCSLPTPHPFAASIRQLLVKLDALATGTSKRLYITPTLAVMVCLLPIDLQRAVNQLSAGKSSVGTAEATVVERILKTIISAFRLGVPF